MIYRNITPRCFTTSTGVQVLQMDEVGMPRQAGDAEKNVLSMDAKVANIALALLNNAWALNDSQLDDVLRWVEMYRRG